MPEDYLSGDALTIEEAAGRRWEAALEILAKGGYIVWRGIGLTFRSQLGGGPPRIAETLYVRVTSAWEPEHVTRTRAEAELSRAKAELEELKQDSPDFTNLITGHPIKYELLYDYGMGAVRLATSDDEGFQYTWK